MRDNETKLLLVPLRCGASTGDQLHGSQYHIQESLRVQMANIVDLRNAWEK
jgi:hypothetical protein